MTQGLLVVLSGFSGAGKGTIVKRLLEKYDNYALSISATTRAPRPGEEEGVHYFFKTEADFDRMVEEDAFLEYARYVAHAYGTPKAYVDHMLQQGRDVILEIELQGALQVRAKRPDTLLVFVTPPSADELARRLVGRGTESGEVIAARMRRAVQESADMDRYDYLLVNDDLETCVDQLHALIQLQHMRTGCQKTFMRDIRAELKKREENAQ